MPIRKITHNDIKSLKKQAESDGLIFSETTQYYGYYDDNLIAFTGIINYSNKVVFKNHWVHPEYRRKGIFRNLFYFSVEKSNGKPIEATCTEMSLPMYLKNGFRIMKKFKNGCTKVRHEGIS